MFDFLIPLHPKLVHFPIALIMTALIFELLGCCLKKNLLSEAAVLIFVFAAALTPIVVYTGLGEETRLKLHHPLLEEHEKFALLTMWISLGSLPVLWLLRNTSEKIFRNFFFFVLLVLAFTVTFAAHYGGKMVYEYGVGVNL
jgi:uncharacterized membrane protein